MYFATYKGIFKVKLENNEYQKYLDSTYLKTAEQGLDEKIMSSGHRFYSRSY
jgi:hypothetical protein